MYHDCIFRLCLLNVHSELAKAPDCDEDIVSKGEAGNNGFTESDGVEEKSTMRD
jgi:hypothetical protein